MTWERPSVLERCAISAATAWGFYLMARFVNHRWHMASLEQQLKESEASLEHERVKRKADRVGRIRAEQELRAVKVQLQQLQLQLQLQQQGQQGRGQSQEHGQGQQAGQSEDPAAKGPGHRTQQAGGPQLAGGGPGEGLDPELGSEEAPEEGQEGQEGEGEGEGGGRQEPAEAGGRVRARAGGSGKGVSQEAKRAAAAAAAALAAAGSAMPAFPFRPIGHLQSVFSERNGTPRQPQLVPAARSRLLLSPSVPRACLEGLEQYSHCWVLYVFHANTDLAKYLSPDRSGLKAKIHVPRLNGGRMGVLATRSPHRPSPIGLSTAQIIKIEQDGSLVLGGADIVDGSPVLDIKPYVPFCDCLPAARAPGWVQAEADDEPLAVGQVVIGPAAQAALCRAWEARRPHSMYDTAEQYIELVRQVLSRDIRSVHQRLNVRPTTTAVAATAAVAAASAGKPAALHAPPPPPQAAASVAPGGGASASASASAAGAEGPGQYHVVLESIYINYDISPSGVVELYDAWVDPITARR